MGLLDNDERRGDRLPAARGRLVTLLLRLLESAQNVGDDQVVQLRRVRVREIDDGHAAGMEHLLVVDGRDAGDVEDVQPTQPVEARGQRAPTHLV